MSRLPELSREEMREGQIGVNNMCALAGKVTCAYGPVPQGTVTVGKWTAVTDAEGNYSLADLQPGDWEVIAAPPPGWSYKETILTMQLKSGEETHRDFYLEKHTGSIEGQVVDEEERPLAGATVSVLLLGWEPTTVTSDKEGRFKLEEVVAGEYFLRGRKEGYAVEGANVKVPIGGKARTTLQLKKGTHRLYGRVLTTQGQPLEAEILLLRSGVIIDKTRSQKDTGEYSFNYLREDLYELFVTAEGCEPRGWIDRKLDMQVNFTLGPVEPASAAMDPTRDWWTH